MRLEKAINYLKKDLLVPGSVSKLEFQDAEQLGIEALKAVKNARANNYYTPIAPLPGETEE